MAEDSDEESKAKLGATVDGWTPVRSPVVFKGVRLRKRLVQAAPSDQAATSEKLRHGPIYRSFCKVKLEEAGAPDDPKIFEFRLGDEFGYVERSARLTGSWRPPEEQSQRIDVAPWVTEAVLAQGCVGETSEFETNDGGESVGEDVGPAARCRLTVLQAWTTQDLLGDGGVVLRVLDPGPGGEKPQNLARVSASWKVWFARNGEFILDTLSAAPQAEGVEFVIDDCDLMVALEMAMREIECGSRVALRVSEQYAQGSLTPQGNPRMNGAAIWAEIRLRRVENELQAGKHATLDEAIAFAHEKKNQGNSALALQTAADYARAARRYKEGCKILQGVIQPDANSSTWGPLADESERPAVDASLTALQLNCAQAELKRCHWQDCIDLCDAVLKRDESSVKARYRRGLAKAELEEYASAVEDLRAVAIGSPTDVGVRKELARVEALLKEHRDEEKRRYGGFIEKAMVKEQGRQQREEIKRKEEDDAAKKAAKVKAKEQDVAMAEMRQKCEAAKARRGAIEAAEAEEEAKKEKSPPTYTKPDTLAGYEYKEKPLTVGAQDQELIGKVEDKSVTAPMLPQNLKTRVVEAAPPVEYQVPSFLRKKEKKSSKP